MNQIEGNNLINLVNLVNPVFFFFMNGVCMQLPTVNQGMVIVPAKKPVPPPKPKPPAEWKVQGYGSPFGANDNQWTTDIVASRHFAHEAAATWAAFFRVVRLVDPTGLVVPFEGNCRVES